MTSKIKIEGSESATAIVPKEDASKVFEHNGRVVNQIDSSDYEDDDDGQYEEVGFEDYDDDDGDVVVPPPQQPLISNPVQQYS